MSSAVSASSFFRDPNQEVFECADDRQDVTDSVSARLQGLLKEPCDKAQSSVEDFVWVPIPSWGAIFAVAQVVAHVFNRDVQVDLFRGRRVHGVLGAPNLRRGLMAAVREPVPGVNGQPPKHAAAKAIVKHSL